MQTIHILTFFPELYGLLNFGITNRAINKLIKLNLIDLKNKEHIDGRVSGGGGGMVIRADKLEKYIDQLSRPIIYLSPRGIKMNQGLFFELSQLKTFSLVCGRYEGIDQRLIDYYSMIEVSLGDFILSNGDIGALALLDGIIRLIPDVITDASLNEESFNNFLLEHNQYTKPEIWKGLSIPRVLLEGDHKKIKQFRYNQSLEITKTRRPDLFDQFLKNNMI